MKRQTVLDQYFVDARSKLLDIAAFLDRLERAEGAEDFRGRAYRTALSELGRDGGTRAKHVLLALSDPTTEPLSKASTQSAVGAWDGAK